ncbi:MAG: virulence factor Mce family protein [Mycobacterium sp.]|uniref:virulence factor Mce family protein n=1 Tax=Mycobacterium sp. TaxID=1785 RepID=UPI001ECAD5B4|nr:virulence factor Mce family protein [Mycobacterium sp.]MBW0017976.1 virulence factor Mce family protein [Mycobacterium sp.]
MRSRRTRIALGITLVAVLIGGVVAVTRSAIGADRTNVVGYFANSNGIYAGDNVVVLGVPVGKIEKVEPEPGRVKISFWYDSKYKVPADAKAVILSPSLVTVRAIQLAPAYTSGPAMAANAVIPQQRTMVPVEYDDLRQQLEKLTQTLQPTQRGGVSTLGAFINTAADNLRGNGADIRDSIVKLSQAVSALADHSADLFTTTKNLATLVSALHDSSDVLQRLNQNLATTTALLANDPTEVADAVRDLNDVVGDVKSFVAENRDALGTTSDKLASVSTALTQSLPDIEQLLHLAPTTFQNFMNIYQPAQAQLTGALALNNFASTTQFLCSAVQAASRLGAEQAAKLCVQYLAPIIKNRQYNFLPFGENLFVGALARPNEVTYSEDWLRPDYIPPPAPQGPQPNEPWRTVPPPPNGPLPPANGIYNYFGHGPANPSDGQPPFVPGKPEKPIPTDPATGLPGMMLPPSVFGGGQ